LGIKEWNSIGMRLTDLLVFIWGVDKITKTTQHNDDYSNAKYKPDQSDLRSNDSIIIFFKICAMAFEFIILLILIEGTIYYIQFNLWVLLFFIPVITIVLWLIWETIKSIDKKKEYKTAKPAKPAPEPTKDSKVSRFWTIFILSLVIGYVLFAIIFEIATHAHDPN
jgi:ABC-type Fe3+ transport system permease subunit